jgi:hypothetical protein
MRNPCERYNQITIYLISHNVRQKLMQFALYSKHLYLMHSNVIIKSKENNYGEKFNFTFLQERKSL